MKRAVFLDRDGVINKLVFNPKTGDYESPHSVDDFELFPWTLDALKQLYDAGYLLFIVSNQPSYAKGKTSLEAIKNIHDTLHTMLIDNGIIFTDYFYCYHHPHGIVPKFSGECECRKPKPYFVLHAKQKHNLDMNHSWFVGDRDADIQCGQAAALTTISIENKHSKNNRGNSTPDYRVPNLRDAVTIILQKGGKG